MTELQLPYGPWKRMLSGSWSGSEIVYYENPNRQLLIFILDKKGDEIVGTTLMMSQIYASDRDPSKLVDSVEGNLLAIQKRTGAFKGDYVIITTTPTYVEFQPNKIISGTEDLHSALEETSKKLINNSRKYSVELTDLEYADEETAQRFFGEPLALPSMIIRKAQGKMISSKKTEKIHLGKKKNGEKAQERTESFRLTIVTGDKEERRHAAHLVLEGSVLNGVPTIIFNEEDKYSRLENPNTDTSRFKKFNMKAEPIGLPIKKFEPGENVFIEPSCLTKKAFSEIAGIRSNSKTAKVISEVLDKNPNNFKEMKKELDKLDSEKKRFHAKRAQRIISVIENQAPEVSEGKNDPEDFIAPWLRKMGRTAMIQLNELDEGIKKGLVYCVIKSIQQHFKKEGTKDLKAEILFERFYQGKGINEEINKLIKKNQEWGIGACITAESEIDLDKELMANASIEISTEGQRKATVKESTKRPYQMVLRPSLSSL